MKKVILLVLGCLGTNVFASNMELGLVAGVGTTSLLYGCAKLYDFVGAKKLLSATRRIAHTKQFEDEHQKQWKSDQKIFLTTEEAYEYLQENYSKNFVRGEAYLIYRDPKTRKRFVEYVDQFGLPTKIYYLFAKYLSLRGLLFPCQSKAAKFPTYLTDENLESSKYCTVFGGHKNNYKVNPVNKKDIYANNFREFQLSIAKNTEESFGKSIVSFIFAALCGGYLVHFCDLMEKLQSLREKPEVE